MVSLVAVEAGVLLPVKAYPKAKKNAVTGFHAGRLKVSVTEAPEKGKANDAIIQLLASSLNLRKSQLTLFKGATSPLKEFLVGEISLAYLQDRITALGLHS